ncbi:hypothetical protein [Nostoc sp.]|uniref:hypothetical protein n=1 Tax=Nostoc sp. TaxID=1180 RepID=UPI002FF45214
MKIRRTLLGLTISILSVMSLSDIWNIQKVLAESVNDTNSKQAVCSNFVTGTYLTTIKNSKGKFASRGLITLTKEGNFIVGDSDQGGVSGVFNPFTTGQGTWACTGRKEITARAIDFSLSNQGGTGIARADYSATFDPTTQTVQGTISLHFFPLQSNPLEGSGTNGGTTFFTGKLVTAK